ncbi:MAG: DUF2807 domain-containing protein [Bacteroidota bacterium]
MSKIPTPSLSTLLSKLFTGMCLCTFISLSAEVETSEKYTKTYSLQGNNLTKLSGQFPCKIIIKRLPVGKKPSVVVKYGSKQNKETIEKYLKVEERNGELSIGFKEQYSEVGNGRSTFSFFKISFNKGETKEVKYRGGSHTITFADGETLILKEEELPVLTLHLPSTISDIALSRTEATIENGFFGGNGSLNLLKIHLRSTGSLQIKGKVQLKSVEISLRGGSYFAADEWHAKNMTLHSRGGSQFFIKELHADALSLQLRGSSEAHFQALKVKEFKR